MFPVKSEYVTLFSSVCPVGSILDKGRGVLSLIVATKESRTRRSSKYPSKLDPFWSVLASASVSFTSVWLYFSELRAGKLGLIDDHEFLSYIGPDRMIAWGEIATILSQTEVGSWGESSRFRPGYYFLRIVQTKFFLGDGYLWYSSRLALFAFSIFLLGITVWVLIGRALRLAPLSSWTVGLIQFAVMTWVIGALISISSWGDILTRLGPSESLVFLGLSLISFGLTVIHSRLDSWVGNLIANAGFILAVTSKENAIVLIVPLLIFVLIQLRERNFTRINLAMLFFSTLVGTWVVSGILLAITGSGVDTYGERRTILSFLGALYFDPRTVFVALLAILIVVIEVGIIRTSITKVYHGRPGALGLMRRYPISLVAFSAISVYFGEHYFYQKNLAGGVFQPARYGMLTELAVVLMSVTTVFLAVKSIGVLRKGTLTIALMVLSPMLALALVSSSLGTIHQAAVDYPNISKSAVAQKAQQMTVIETAAKSLETTPDMQVLIFADEPYDYEKVYSLPIFLDFYSGRDVSFYLETRIPDDLKTDGLFLELSASLDKTSLNGGWKVSPIREFDSQRQTLCIYFGQLAESDVCTITLGLD
jgi:hypothetical protein